MADLSRMAVQIAAVLGAAFLLMAVISVAFSRFALNRLATLEKRLSDQDTKRDRSNSEPNTWMEQVQTDVWNDSGEPTPGERGIVVAPLTCPEAWYNQSRELRIENSLMYCAQTFATLSRKEVMISGQVVRKKITITTDTMSSENALKSLRSAIEAQGIAVIPINERILALVSAPTLPL
jgi:hypothetical protein